MSTDQRAAWGTATRTSTPLPMWISAVLDIAHVSRADAARIVTLARLHRWYDDGMTAAMAADSTRFWVDAARKGERADRSSYLRNKAPRSQ